jgi:spore maturation protein CgeB
MLYKTEILILDCPEIQCPKVLRIVYTELCGAFERGNVKVRIIENINEIHDDAIVFMGDFISVVNPGQLLATISKNAVYIGWYWHNHDVSMLPYFLHVYENVLSNTLLADKAVMKKFMDSIPNSCPLLLRANEAIEKIGTYPRQEVYDFCFMGGRMCEDLVPSHKFKGFYLGVHDTKEYMPYDERRKIYLSSTFALGFQTDDNIKNGHVSQRIFEAMAYGCVVLSNSIHASIQTDGIVEYVDPDKEKFAERMEFFLQNPQYIRIKQQRGYEFVCQYGTNHYSISLIMNKLSAIVSGQTPSQEIHPVDPVSSFEG